MNYILFDGIVRTSLLPLTYIRPVADIRVGILTIREKWEKFLGFTTTTITEEYLEEKYPMVEMEENVLLNASFIPTVELVTLVKELKQNQAILYNEELVAFYTTNTQEEVDFDTYEVIEIKTVLHQIKNTYDIFTFNDYALKLDYEMLTEGRKSQLIPDTVQCINRDQIFLEEGVDISFATLNASTGPIYISKDSVIMEGCLIRGPFAMGKKSVLKMGAKVYGATTLGPRCTVGGEVNNVVLFGFSNKGHEGFLGNAVLGEWCNIGADTNNSNLKNNYAIVKLWNYEANRFTSTNLQFCGLIMGDHSKCGINTMFNTGTVIGVSSNIYGSNFPRNFIPSFSWGGAAGFTTYNIEKAFETAEVMMKRRDKVLDEKEKAILEHVFNESKKYR